MMQSLVIIYLYIYIYIFYFTLFWAIFLWQPSFYQETGFCYYIGGMICPFVYSNFGNPNYWGFIYSYMVHVYILYALV